MVRRIARVGEPELRAVAEFITRQSPSIYSDYSTAEYLTYLRWLMLANPAREGLQNFGWMALDEQGEIVGTQLFFPQRFNTRSGQIVAFVSNASFADAKCRESKEWAFLFNEYRKLAATNPLLGNTANTFSAAFFRRLGAQRLVGWNDEWVSLLRPTAFAREVWARLRRRPEPPALPLAAAEKLAAVDSQSRISSPAELLDIASRVQTAGDVTADRGPAFLSWRFFEKPRLCPTVFRVAQRGRPFAAAVLPFFKGKARLRALRVLEVFGADHAAMPSVIRAIREAFPATVECVVWQPSPEVVQRPSFTLSWKFTETRGWCLDPRNHSGSLNWRVGYSDGDAGM